MSIKWFIFCLVVIGLFILVGYDIQSIYETGKPAFESIREIFR